VHARHDLAPQPPRLEHVHLVDRGDARAGGAERDPGDPLDLPRAVLAQVRRVGLRARLRAEVDAAGELADDEQVGALDQLALERARVVERGQRADRAQVGVEAERLAQPEQPCSGRGAPGSVESHFGPADGGEQDGVGRAAGHHGVVGQRAAVRVDGGAAEGRARRR
jgi:hypothetical protein